MNDDVKTTSRWYSDRVKTEITVVRWGTFGRPVLVFPSAGGDAEEIERFGLVDACGPLLAEGRVKLYSVDSVAGRAMITKEGSPDYRMWLLNQFHECVRWEVLPAIHADLGGQAMDVIASGASIGAFNAVAVLCRYPDVFSAAIGMSGSYTDRALLRRGVEPGPVLLGAAAVPAGPGRPAAGHAPRAVRRARVRGGRLGEHRRVLADGVGPGGEGDTQPGGQLGPAMAARVAHVAPDAAAVPPRAHLTHYPIPRFPASHGRHGRFTWPPLSGCPLAP